MQKLIPQEIVAKLNECVIGQLNAKRAVAVALRNRWRRQQLGRKLRDSITPKNILMIGPSGVGKTEIARQLARISNAPFIKVEATKYTGIGYVGLEVESMVQDLMDIAMSMPKLCENFSDTKSDTKDSQSSDNATELDSIIRSLMEKNPRLAGKGKVQFSGKRNNANDVIKIVEQHGIIFIDEIDKICVPSDGTRDKGISNVGVQRDLLPLVEGTTVKTSYGMVNTNHILFIASGAFHLSSPTDMIPELQGRFPVKVVLEPLLKDDFKRILTDTNNSLIKQYAALVNVENVKLKFTAGGIDRIAEICFDANDKYENIGARRLHGILEHLLEDISYSASEHSGQTLTVDEDYVNVRLANYPVKTET